MKQKIKNTLRELTNHLGLKVVFVSYFPASVHGRLLPREKRILINAHEPHCEHIFTLLHEIGHFLLHFQAPRRKHHPRIFEIHWKGDRLASACSTVRRYFRHVFNSVNGREWEADLWAMCAFIYIANRLGCHRELQAFLKRHPEKSGMFLLATAASFYGSIKTTIKKSGAYWQGRFKMDAGIGCAFDLKDHQISAKCKK